MAGAPSDAVDSVLEMELGGVHRPLFQRFPVGLEVSVTKCGEGEPFGNRRVANDGRDLAVMEKELDDRDAKWEFDESLGEPHQQLLDLGGPGLGLFGGDLADGHEMLLAPVPEDEP
jgi:hypothetical protein